MSEVRQTWSRRKLSAALGLILLALHIISCSALGSRMYIWDYVTHRKGLNWNGRIKRFGPNSRINDYWNFLGRASPSFDNSSARNVTTQLGQTVYLHCIVHNLGDKTVSWIRRRDFHVLTVGLDTYTTDDRFQAIHMERSNDWSLQIKYPHLRDAGLYECQVGSDPKISFFVNLNVVVAKAEILGPHPLYVKTGSSINLTCTITQSPEPPVFVFWYHDDRMINYDSSRGDITLHKAGNDTAISKLYIRDAQPIDTGNYTCGPSNTDATSISVYVLNGEKPAAMQHDANASRSTSPARVNLSPSLFLLLALFCR